MQRRKPYYSKSIESPFTKKGKAAPSSRKVKRSVFEETESNSMAMIEEQSQCSYSQISYSIDHLNEDLKKKASVREQSGLLQEILLKSEHFLGQKAIFQKTEKYLEGSQDLAQNNCQILKQNSQINDFGEMIMKDKAFRNSVAEIILQEV